MLNKENIERKLSPKQEQTHMYVFFFKHKLKGQHLSEILIQNMKVKIIMQQIHQYEPNTFDCH